MRKLLTALVMLGMTSNLATAATLGEKQAGSFANIYASLCLKHLNHLDELREKLQAMPKLPAEKAAHFLAGKAGDAWPVPDQHGTFVLALAFEKNFCAVYARKADTEAAKQQFARLVDNAPAPLVVTRTAPERTDTAANGTTETVSYTWAVPNGNRRMLFMLTTASAEYAQLQVMASASLINP